MGQTNQSNNLIIYNISLYYDVQFSFNELGIWKIIQKIEKISMNSLFILLKKAQAVVQKTSRENVTETVLIFSAFLAGFYNKGVALLLCPFLP